MKGKRYTSEQIINRLREAEAALNAGQTIGQVCQKLGISEQPFHARVRDELLNAEVFNMVAEAKMLAMRWRLDYNHRRPHGSLGYVTPAAFAASLAAPAVWQAKKEELVIFS